MSKDALRCLARVRSFQQHWSDNEAEREVNRRVLDNGADAFTGIPGLDIQDAEGNPIPLTVLNYYVRLRSRIEGKCFDESPELEPSREVLGTEEHAEAVGRLASRLTEEARLPSESRDGITSVMTEGGYGVVYGMPNLPDAADVNERAKGTAQILTETLEAVKNGTPPPPPVFGQDHAMIAQVLAEVASDPINVAANRPEATQALIDMAAAHVQAQEDEEKSNRYWRYDENAIFTDRVEIGSHLAWDLTYGDPKRGSWLAYAIELSLDEARGHPKFKPGVRKRLVVSAKETKQGEPDRSVRVEGESEDEHNAENGTVKIWVYFDKKRRKVHYIPEALESGEIEFLEADDKNPYLDESGDPLLPWFWPVAVFCYRKRAKRGTHRSLPVPYMRNGWDQQIESIKTDTVLLEGLKAAMQDKYVANDQVDGDTLEALTNGRLHVVVKKPAGIERGEKCLEAIDFKPPLKEAYEERAQQQQRFCQGANYPFTEFSGLPMSSTTLGQTEIATSSGSEAMSDLSRMLEGFYGEIVQGLLLIASAKMPPETAAHYMGAEMEEAWEGWRQAVRRGNTVRVKFAPTTREMNPVRAKQLMDGVVAGQSLVHLVGPLQGLPMVEPASLFRLFNEACKNMGFGGMKPYQPTPEDIAAMQMQAEQAAQNPENPDGGGNEKGGGSGAQSRERPNRQSGGRQDRQRGPAGRGQIASASRRV